MKSKYYSHKTECLQGHLHDSAKEAKRCNELHLLLKANKISNLEIQRKFVLIPAVRYQDMPNERGISYVADFSYMENGKNIIEDTKGYRTQAYIIKRKIFKEKYCQNGDLIFKEV